MNILNRETINVQNPALGAMLIWRFVTGFESASKTRNHPNLPLIFIILPLLFQEEIADIITSTRSISGLRAFTDKFASSSISKNDLLISLNERILHMKELTFNSLMIAISSNLLTIDVKNATVIPITITPPKVGIPETIKKLLILSEKIGIWCAPLSNHEIGLTLKIGL
jgi:hypothetical protein